jgi:pyruvate,water dikinase
MNAETLPAAATTSRKFIRKLRDVRLSDLPLVGGKNASLGEMLGELAGEGIPVPDGFAVTAEGYRHFLRYTGLTEKIRTLLGDLKVEDVEKLQRCGYLIRQAILEASMPEDLQDEIVTAYGELDCRSYLPLAVAVRSSATAEDLPDASFAGQQETYLNVQGAVAVLECCRKSFASLFTDRAICYRAQHGFDHFQVSLSVGVQVMVRSDLATSGVMFTLDTESGFRDVVLINAAYGLGENIVQGAVTPDEYCIFKPTLKQGFHSIIRKRTGSKEFKMVCDIGGGKMVKNVPVSDEERGVFSILDEEALQLARWACIIEAHYSAKAGKAVPMDIEWAKDGLTGQLYILQARPETVQSRRKPGTLESFTLEKRGQVLVSGRSVGDKIATGRVRILKCAADMTKFQAGEVLVADKTDPDWEPVMKRAAAIVTNRGGRTCHAAIVSRELGVAAIVGTEEATGRLYDGQSVTVSCAEGDEGFVYAGALPFSVSQVHVDEFKRPRTKVLLNVANPERAFALSFLPNDGVGLARMEFIISNSIKVHPMALLGYDRFVNSDVKDKIAVITRGYDDKPQFFVDRLAEGVGMLAAAFYPKDVILRFSDFKTNEYANLLGGSPFEPQEENPMLGFRGASRYYNPRYQAGFALECRAVKKVRDEMGLKNLKLMVPFCRTVQEGKRVITEMAKHGLRRGKDGLQVYVMCEIPSNVLLADQFAKIFDGFSIGSNDLTQLVLGVDRDSEIVAPLFDERNDAVKKMIAMVIATARDKGRKIGICGQAPSDYPEFAEFLVEERIDSISLNPDTVLKTTSIILETEKRLSLTKERT